MASLRSLPQSHRTWEIAELPAPVAEARAILLVVETDTGLVRATAVVSLHERVDAHVRQAFTHPAAGTAARPRAVIARDPVLLGELGPLLEEAGVRGVFATELPTFDEVATSLLASFGGPPAPGIRVDLGAWRQSLDACLACAPWTHLADDVVFSFRGGGLDGTVAVVIGNGGELRGLVLYPSRTEHARFLRASESRDFSDTRAWTLHIEPTGEVAADERAACAKVGLALAGGDYPRLYALDAGAFETLDDDEQRRFRLALDAVIACCSGRKELIASGRSVSATFRRGGLVVEVRAEPPEPPLHLLLQANCGILTGQMARTAEGGPRVVYPALVLKLQKKDAQKLAAQLGSVDRLVLRRGELIAATGLGTLGRLVSAHVDAEGQVATWKHGEDVLLAVSAGGSTRASLRPEDILWSRVARFERDPG